MTAAPVRSAKPSPMRARDTINFAVTGTITLTSGALELNRGLNIIGPGATNLTVSGNKASSVFYDDVLSGGNFFLSALTVADGGTPDVDGGGVYTDSIFTCTISDCVFKGCISDAGGAIFNGGFGASS